jgi:hypothetical protein
MGISSGNDESGPGLGFEWSLRMFLTRVRDSNYLAVLVMAIAAIAAYFGLRELSSTTWLWGTPLILAFLVHALLVLEWVLAGARNLCLVRLSWNVVMAAIGYSLGIGLIVTGASSEGGMLHAVIGMIACFSLAPHFFLGLYLTAQKQRS